MGAYSEPGQDPSPGTRLFRCRPDGVAYLVLRDGPTLVVRKVAGDESSRWLLRPEADRLGLKWVEERRREPETTELLAAFEAAFAAYPDSHCLDLSVPVRQADELLRTGIALVGPEDRLTVCADLFWQQPRIWLASFPPYPFPVHYVLSQGRRHPLRAPKPTGTVYCRYIPGLDRSLSFRTVDIEDDLERFSRWMNDPVVAEFWQEEGDLSRHRAHLENIAGDPHVIGLVACFDDEPFGYFEAYWAKEDRIAPFYDVDDFDRGWHVLIGEARFRGKPFVAAWLPSLSHYLFLDDCRTRRLVIEPRSDNDKMIRNLAKCGYANLKEFDFPHKRATLGMLLRERFFSERLWVPRSAEAAQSVESTP